MKLDPSEFEALRDLVYKKTGLMFDDRKRDFMQARVARRAVATACATARDYVYHLRYYDPNGAEFQQFVESLTTNETYFFRDYPQLECFANEALPIVAERKRASGDPNLSIWSAACSTGDEPYTLAIILRICLDDFSRWRIRLLATDIDNTVLDLARQASYSKRAIQEVPKEYLDRFFVKANGEHRVVEAIKRMVTFAQLNLMDREAMSRNRGFDFILCRNVLIYFDDRSRRHVLESFFEALVPGGFLFLGHAESVGRISTAYESITLGDTIVYRKPHNARILRSSPR